ELDGARERGELAHADVVGDALPVFEGAVLAPDLAHLARETAILLHLLLRHGHDKSIGIGHRGAPPLRSGTGGRVAGPTRGRHDSGIRRGLARARLAAMMPEAPCPPTATSSHGAWGR